jgi:hypothetical protein
VPGPDQRLLPGRLGLRLDHLLSLGEPFERGGAHQQDSGPLTKRTAAPSANLISVTMPVVAPATSPVSPTCIKFLRRAPSRERSP